MSPLLVIPSLMLAAATADPVLVLDSMDTPDNWRGHGISISVSQDCVEGPGSLMLSGSGHVRLSHKVLKKVDVGKYDRLLMNVKIPKGHVTDFGLVTGGFPQPGEIRNPRWAKYDESAPDGVWMEYSCNLRLCEWGGGSPKLLDPNSPALSLLFTPGKGSTAVLVDHVRLVKDPIRIAYDWLKPIRPLRIVKGADGLRYEKEVVIQNVSGKDVDVSVRFSDDSLQKFGGTVDPSTATLRPGPAQTFTARITVPAGLAPLEHEVQTLEVVPDGDDRLVQRLEILTAAPFPPVKHPFTTKKAEKPRNIESLLRDNQPIRLPKHPCYWMSQSTLNTGGRCAEGHLGQAADGFDRLKCRTCGVTQEETSLTGGVFHRRLIRQASDLGRAYQATKDVRYAKRARDIFLAYANGYHQYPMKTPLNEASSYLSPYNATYILGSVIMTPMPRALDLIWDSGALTARDKKQIGEGFLMPAALEMMKIYAGMTNMQDAMNEAIFNMGLVLGDPNLVATALRGSHGLEAKISSVFDEDGATPESISPGYHGAGLRPVLAQVNSIRNAGLSVDLKFERLEKAKKLMAYLRMPDGRVPNRGDAAFPGGGVDPELRTYGSMVFRHFGMTVLREGQGPDALYVALDHRPPAVTHSHHDKLGIIFYGKGEYLGVDEGSLYNTDTSKQSHLPNWRKRSRWSHHSLVHNTITVDETGQVYGGGHLLYFHGDKDGHQAVSAYTDNVYQGVLLERNIVMLGGVMVLVDRCLSETEHTYDWAYHSFGELTGPEGLEPREKLGEKHPYDLPENARWGALDGSVEFTWKREKASLRLLFVPDGKTEYGTAIGWANRAYQDARREAPFVLARRRGKNAMFVTVFEPHKGAVPGIRAVSREPVLAQGKPVPSDQAVGLKITKGGEDLTFLVSFTAGEKTCGPIRTQERYFAARERAADTR